MNKFVLAVALPLCLFSASRVHAQADSSTVDPAVVGAIARARSLVDGGSGANARALLDSLVTAQAVGSNESAEALYWRAVLSERASDAERDWKQLVIEIPLSPRIPDALLWLGELELVRGHTVAARAHLDRLLRDFASVPQRGKAMLWIARSYWDERDTPRACAATAALRSSGVPDGELRLQVDEMTSRCAAATAAAAAPRQAAAPVESTTVAAATPPASTAPAKADAGRFSVQLAAYGTRAEATAAVRRFAKRGITARVEGERKPYRVRTGRYTTRAAATSAMNALRKRGVKGIVAETAK